MKNDVFLSYAEEDRVLAAQIAAALTARGWSVWWDRQIPPGRTWRQTIEEAITGMGCMVVLWSTHSIQSPWVQEEAEEGLALARLVPVLIESVRPPMGFRSIQACDLRQRDGEMTSAAGFQQLLVAIEALVGVASSPVRETIRQDRESTATETRQVPAELERGGRRMAFILVACAVALAAAIVHYALPGPSSNTREAVVVPAPLPRSSSPVDVPASAELAAPGTLPSATAPSAAPSEPRKVVAAATARPATAAPRQTQSSKEPRSPTLSIRCAAIRDRRDLGDPVSPSELKECRL
ncbi:toll/interleukin-1 receptor domain-containing protein [Accumulibacter sp.]|uniref:toll/interleukin-1 receptor domain-containing protein n=1 Tax=Accumulibacter sp. TaxID=2053492 RepID=UPI0035B2757D